MEMCWPGLLISAHSRTPLMVTEVLHIYSGRNDILIWTHYFFFFLQTQGENQLLFEVTFLLHFFIQVWDYFLSFFHCKV